MILAQLHNFRGDFITGLERTNDLMVGFVEGIASNKHFKLQDLVDLVLSLNEKFGFFIKNDDENKIKLNKNENEIDEAFFGGIKDKQRTNYARTFKIQEGAAAGTSIGVIISENHK